MVSNHARTVMQPVKCRGSLGHYVWAVQSRNDMTCKEPKQAFLYYDGWDPRSYLESLKDQTITIFWTDSRMPGEVKASDCKLDDMSSGAKRPTRQCTLSNNVSMYLESGESEEEDQIIENRKSCAGEMVDLTKESEDEDDIDDRKPCANEAMKAKLAKEPSAKKAKRDPMFVDLDCFLDEEDDSGAIGWDSDDWVLSGNGRVFQISKEKVRAAAVMVMRATLQREPTKDASVQTERALTMNASVQANFEKEEEKEEDNEHKK